MAVGARNTSAKSSVVTCRLLLIFILLHLGCRADAQSAIFLGQHLYVNSTSHQLLHGTQHGRVICNRFNTYCFGYGNPQNPQRPTLFRKSDNVTYWCPTNPADNLASGQAYVKIFRNETAIMSFDAAEMASGASIFRSRVPVGDATRWVEIEDDGSLALYESTIAFKAMANINFNELEVNYRGIIPVQVDLNSYTSHNGGYVLDQSWDGNLRVINSGGQLIYAMNSQAARTMQAGLYGELTTFDADQVPVWTWNPKQLIRPAYWRIGDDGNVTFIQGRLIDRIARGAPASECTNVSSTNPAPQPGTGASTPTTTSGRVTSWRVMGIDPPSSTPSAVSHPSPW